ncbi:hypothetical protein WJX81_005539 [Elliptochloris bilobata]|uniref:Transaldolase n=1 Tax=Elliptochloris bilobata TaxID=381761 RepID=A0AAW1QND9_9CHLO
MKLAARPAATELDLLESFSVVVPDTGALGEIQQIDDPKAATVSSAVLTGILRNPAGQQELKAAIEHAITFDRCSALPADRKLACQLDKATVNVGALFAQKVAGRVSTEVDPRLAYNTGAIVERAEGLLALYEEMGVPGDRVLVRIPATWEGIQAAKALEAKGIATHLILVYSFVQAVAAAQAGVSVVQPNIGRLHDWYVKHPGFPRDPKGPREDSGFTSDANPGLAMVERIYNLCHQAYPKTKVMVSGIRKPEEARSLSGVDFMVLSPPVLAALRGTPTLQGYNDGLSSESAAANEPRPQLSQQAAAAASFDKAELAPVTNQLLQEGLGMAGVQLLKEGVDGLVADIERLVPFFTSLTIGNE